MSSCQILPLPGSESPTQIDCLWGSNRGNNGRLLPPISYSWIANSRFSTSGLTLTSIVAIMLLPCGFTPSISIAHVPGRLKAASAEKTPGDSFSGSTVMGPMPLSIWVILIVADSMPVTFLLSLSKNETSKLFWPNANGLIESLIRPSCV
jgi:hypothetical protein